MNEYVVICELAAAGGWSGYVPDVPGVVRRGNSTEEIEKLMCEALELHREELAKHGEVPPPPRIKAGLVRI